MPVTNRYSGFQTRTGAPDNDSEFGENLNRHIPSLSSASSITNRYSENYANRFGSTARFSTNEQRLVQSMVQETIHINGITVRYMPRHFDYEDDLWNERPEGKYDRGFQIDVLLESASGFEGEGQTFTQYGIEFKEEVELRMSIPRFDELFGEYHEGLPTQELEEKIQRTRPLEGDLVVIPFGRSSEKTSQYFPKFFEILRVQTYNDGGFFQLGDNFQYRIVAKLFELSSEDIDFKPKVKNNEGEQSTIIERNTEGVLTWFDSDEGLINITDDSEDHYDPYADNRLIEERSQKRKIYEEGELVGEDEIIISDYTATAFGYKSGIINNLDDI